MKMKKIKLIVFFLICMFLFINLSIYADTTDNLFSSTFGDNNQLMYAFSNVANISKSIFRSIMWQLILIVESIVDGIGYVLGNIFSINIFDIPFLQEWSVFAKMIGLSFFSLTILIAGITVMFKGSRVIQNIFMKFIIIVVLVLFLPSFMNYFFNTLVAPVTDLVGGSDINIGEQIILNNTYDVQSSLEQDEVVFLLDGNVSTDEESAQNNIRYIRYGNIPTSLVDQESLQNTSYYNKKSLLDEDGYTVEDLAPEKAYGVGDGEKLYRYSFDFWKIFVPLCTVAIAILIFCVKLGKTYLFEIPIGIIMSIMFFIPMSNEKKIFKIVEDLLIMVLGILFSLLMLGFYLQMVVILTAAQLDFFSTSIINISLASILIFGSYFINRILNYDIRPSSVSVPNGDSRFVPTYNTGASLDGVKGLTVSNNEIGLRAESRNLSAKENDIENTSQQKVGATMDMSKVGNVDNVNGVNDVNTSKMAKMNDSMYNINTVQDEHDTNSAMNNINNVDTQSGISTMESVKDTNHVSNVEVQREMNQAAIKKNDKSSKASTDNKISEKTKGVENEDTQKVK